MINTNLLITQAHTRTSKEILTQLKTTPNGLSDIQVAHRLKTYGPNILPQSQKTSALYILLNQFRSTVVLILFLASTISFIYDHLLDGYLILGIIIINALVGFIQEYQAEKSIEALKNLVVPQTRVRRNSKIMVISSQEVVPGDIIICSEGDSIPADARLLKLNNLQVDESSLTGESMPVTKSVSTLSTTPIALAEQTNMLRMGTQIVAGDCEAIVISTGSHTTLGIIAKDLSGVEEEVDHFKIKTNQLGTQMGLIAIASTLIIFIVGFYIRNFNFQEIFMFSVASLVSALPEGLPVILTVILALSAKRMANKKALVRRLSATETLAVVDTIITDKTGTLTQNLMTATIIEFPFQPTIKVSHQTQSLTFNQAGTTPTPEHYPLQKLLDITGSCHNVKREFDAEGTEHIGGDPTEVALVTLADKAIASPSYYQRKIHQLQDLPFNQKNRWRASLVNYHDKKSSEIFVIGSPESLINQCTHILLPDHHTHNLEEKYKDHVQEQITHLTSKGMRVLALTYKPHTHKTSIQQDDIENLTYVGLVGLIDPPHPETKAAIAKAHHAGINVIMATGDHPLTAKTIGLELGLITKDTSDNSILTETDIMYISDQELSQKLQTVKIFARMSPTSKLRLATILQNNGKVVAMTGDGVNDAPALKQADIGISMGKRGTDVARQASDIVLADDNFATIINAIAEGRTQLRNVRRTSFFYITTNLAESLTLLVFLFIGLPIPLLPKQILWLNLVSGGITDLALATEPISRNVLSDPPSSKSEAILNKKNIPFLAILTLTMVALGIIFFMLYQYQGIAKSRTILFIVLSLSQIYNMYNMRSLNESLFTIGVFSSRNINIAFIISLILMLLVIYVPSLQYLFEFSSITIFDLIITTIACTLVIVVGETYKKIAHT